MALGTGALRPLPQMVYRYILTSVKLSRDQFAELCGVSKMAVSKAIRRGAVVEDDRGRVDMSLAANAEYRRQDHGAAKQAPKVGGTGAGRGKRSDEIAQLHKQKLIEQIRNLNAMTAKHDVERARKLDLYTERRMVDTALIAFGADWGPQILDLPKRLVPIVYEMCRAGESLQKAISYAEKEISEATKALKAKVRAVGLGDLTT